MYNPISETWQLEGYLRLSQRVIFILVQWVCYPLAHLYKRQVFKNCSLSSDSALYSMHGEQRRPIVSKPYDFSPKPHFQNTSVICFSSLNFLLAGLGFAAESCRSVVFLWDILWLCAVFQIPSLQNLSWLLSPMYTPTVVRKHLCLRLIEYLALLLPGALEDFKLSQRTTNLAPEYF